MIRVHLKDGELRRVLARKNLSQNAFARRIQVSSGYLSQLLSGKRYPSPRVREVMLAALPEAEFDQLFEVVDGADGRA